MRRERKSPVPRVEGCPSKTLSPRVDDTVTRRRSRRPGTPSRSRERSRPTGPRVVRTLVEVGDWSLVQTLRESVQTVVDNPNRCNTQPVSTQVRGGDSVHRPFRRQSSGVRSPSLRTRPSGLAEES